jgi:hypothetical protein
VPRTLLCCAALAVLALPARAEQTITSTETLIRLTVRPMPAPKPALRYLLLPELKELNPGNPIPNYLKALMDQDFSSDQEVISRAALRRADQAARLDKPDWQILHKVKTDGVGLLLPDVQKIRALAAALQERFRDENSQRRFDDCIRTAKTMFAMARHMSEHPTLIGDLVGMAIAFVAIVPLEEMLEKPGCPNLYWALTDLPNPLVPLDRGLEGERVLIQAELNLLDERVPMSADQIKRLIVYVDKLRALDSKKPATGTRAWLDERNKDEKVIGAARSRLVEAGFAEERLRRFPADQVLLLDEKVAYEVKRDDTMKLMKLPAWQIEALAAKDKRPRNEGLFGFLTPAVIKVRRAQSRLEQRVALLRHVEALRLYAAANDGKLPAKLSDCAVPLPDDPFTGKPFRYEVKGSTAHLRGSPPPGEAKNPGYNFHYEVTVK